MVKFVGGPSPNAYKSYKNHTIAREGQWRMPRAYGSVKKEVKINIREYNYHGNSYGNYGGFQLPAWLQWLNAGMGWVNQFIPQPQETPVAPTPNNNDQTLEDLQKQIDELKKENEELKNKPTTEVEDPKKENKPVEINANVDLSTKEDVETTTTPDTVEEKTIQVNNKTRRVSGSTYEGYTWTSLQNAYVAEDGSTVPNSPSFRNWFRQTYLNNATDIGVNEQHYPKEITYGGKTYKFSTDKYKPTQYTVDNGYKGTSAHTSAVTETKKGTTTTKSSWSGVAKATWTDKDGKTQTKTITVSGMESKEAAIAKLKADIKGQVPAEAKLQFGAKEK